MGVNSESQVYFINSAPAPKKLVLFPAQIGSPTLVLKRDMENTIESISFLLL